MDRKDLLIKIKKFGIEGASGNVQKINDIAELLEILNIAKPDTEADILMATIRSLSTIFQGHLNRDHGKWLNPVEKSDESSAKKKVDSWLRNKYTASLSAIIKLVAHPELPLAWAAVDTIMSLCKAEVRALGASIRAEVRAEVFSEVIGQLVLTSTTLDPGLVKRFFSKYVNVYGDVYLRTLKSLSRWMKAKLSLHKHTHTSSSPSPTSLSQSDLQVLDAKAVADRVHLMLSGLEAIQPGKTWPQFFVPSAEEGHAATAPPAKKARPGSSGSNKQQTNAKKGEINAKKLRKALDRTWLLFLSLPMQGSLLKSLLVDIDKNIFPFIIRPVLLMDFLTDAYAEGGLISLLALSGLFVLMTKYNLDYPHFYDQLYALFTPDVFYLSFRDQIFSYTARFLSSTHLPAYLVAAFIKRLCTIAILAPPAGILTALAMVFNLLQRHPQCGVLINRTHLGSNPTVPAVSDPPTEDNVLLLDLASQKDDPYLRDETNPAKSRAIDSSLWELELLESHYCPAVSKFVQVFKKPYDPKASLYQIQDFSSLSYDILIKKEVIKRITSVPTEFESRTTLFQSGSIFETLWDWQ